MAESVAWVSAKSAPSPSPPAQTATGRRRRAVNVARRAVDSVRPSRTLSNLAIGAVLCGAAVVPLHNGGLELLIQSAPALAVIFGAATALIRAGDARGVPRPPAYPPSRGTAAAVSWLRPTSAARGDRQP